MSPEDLFLSFDPWLEVLFEDCRASETQMDKVAPGSDLLSLFSSCCDMRSPRLTVSTTQACLFHQEMMLQKL